MTTWKEKCKMSTILKKKKPSMFKCYLVMYVVIFFHPNELVLAN